MPWFVWLAIGLVVIVPLLAALIVHEHRKCERDVSSSRSSAAKYKHVNETLR